jgi:hypothetical protein
VSTKESLRYTSDTVYQLTARLDANEVHNLFPTARLDASEAHLVSTKESLRYNYLRRSIPAHRQVRRQRGAQPFLSMELASTKHMVEGLLREQLRGVIIPQRLSVASNAIDHPSLGHNNNEGSYIARSSY